jgi:OmpA-OmpF porin, OOP family
MVKRAGLAVLTLALGACAVTRAPGPGNLANPAQPGYVTSSGGIVKSGLGLCWHTRDWAPEKAVAPCDLVAVAKAPMKRVAAPEPVAASEPMPAPKMAAPEPTPAPKPAPVIQRVALDTELLFDFDSAVLRPAGRAKLEELALDVRGARIEGIEAVGHADRIAPESYNQELSEERAAAVKDYLVKLGFDPRSIDSEGLGETDPVTAGRCAGLGRENRDNLKLVRCLQPDRRVELEVRGVKKGGA